MSGVASIGKRWKLHTASTTSAATATSTNQRTRIDRSISFSSIVVSSMIVHGAGLLDIGADEKGVVGHVFGARFEPAQHLGPFGRLASEPQHAHLVCLADL